MPTKKVTGSLVTNYKLIPINEITDEAREIAVLWGEAMRYNFIQEKHKLASDIMNYAIQYHEKMKLK